jgi:hypothetical protein
MKVTTAPPKIQIELPNLATDGRVCFYGYNFSIEWLIEYATTHWRWGPIDSGGYDDISKITGGLNLLRMHSGIKRLKLESGIKDHAAPANTTTIPGYRPGEVRVTVMSIFSDEGPSFRRRPSQENVDRLSEIMGKQPRWWVDYDDPQTYGYHRFSHTYLYHTFFSHGAATPKLEEWQRTQS